MDKKERVGERAKNETERQKEKREAERKTSEEEANKWTISRIWKEYKINGSIPQK